MKVRIDTAVAVQDEVVRMSAPDLGIAIEVKGRAMDRIAAQLFLIVVDQFSKLVVEQGHGHPGVSERRMRAAHDVRQGEPELIFA